MINLAEASDVIALVCSNCEAGRGFRVAAGVSEVNREDRAKIGAGTVNRTPDLRITNALLYHLSYSGKTR